VRRELVTIGDLRHSQVMRRNVYSHDLGRARARRVELGALDDPSYAALWTIYATTGLRPEYLLPVLSSESGLDPSTPNRAGAPFYGINQASGAYLSARGISPADYLTWPASEQLTRVVGPMLAGVVRETATLPRSATRLYQANFLPVTLKGGGGGLSRVLAWRGGPVYAANAGLDWQRRGAILVDDLAFAMMRQARNVAVRSAIAKAYAIAPAGAGSPREPVYGQDFVDPLAWFAGLGIVGVVATLALGRKGAT
jgi:hypothetical protein